MESFTKSQIYPYAKEVKESSDIKEVTQLLQGKEWVAIDATSDGKICLIRV